MERTLMQEVRPPRFWMGLIRSLTGALLVTLFVQAPQVHAQARAQMTFATPEEAAATLLQALNSNDLDKLKAMFGATAPEELSSGDPVLDRHDREAVGLAMKESWRWVSRGPRKELVIGAEAWPFPVPLAKNGNRWQFDTAAGKEELLARRVGRNELTIISLCGYYVQAQQQYASKPRDGKQAGLYAQKFRSTSGLQDGLYWTVKPGQPPSPLGDLAARADAGGYDREKNPSSPFMGYYFRILTAQGSAAPGGARSYIVNGGMSGGFALLAYPAKYAYSGVMSFIVNQDGVVYQKDLGSDTAKLVEEISTYNPDKSWRKVRIAD